MLQMVSKLTLIFKLLLPKLFLYVSMELMSTLFAKKSTRSLMKKLERLSTLRNLKIWSVVLLSLLASTSMKSLDIILLSRMILPRLRLTILSPLIWVAILMVTLLLEVTPWLLEVRPKVNKLMLYSLHGMHSKLLLR